MSGRVGNAGAGRGERLNAGAVAVLRGNGGGIGGGARDPANAERGRVAGVARVDEVAVAAVVLAVGVGPGIGTGGQGRDEDGGLHGGGWGVVG